MNKFFDIIGKLKAEDVPIQTFRLQKEIQEYLKNNESVTYQEIADHLNISLEEVLSIMQEASIFWRDHLTPKSFFKAMMKSSDGDNEEFEIFFQRPDVDFCCLCIFNISDNLKRMQQRPALDFIKNNWEKYRGY